MEQNLEELVKSYNIRNALENRNNQNFYHYTSNDAFKSITNTNPILLSNVQEMNDKSECCLCFEIIKESVKKKGTVSNKIIKAVSDKFYKKLDEVFVFSFSTEDDDVAQWERYADNAEGVCLVSSYERVVTWMNRNEIDCDHSSDVKYLECNSALNDIPNHWITDYEKIFNQCYAQNTNDVSNYLLDNNLNLLVTFCSLFKNRTFRSEKEYRIIVINDPIRSKSCNNHTRLIPRKDKPRLEFNNAFLPISQLQDNTSYSLFSEVVFGPRSGVDPVVLQDYLRNERGLDVTVSKSNSSLR